MIPKKLANMIIALVVLVVLSVMIVGFYNPSRLIEREVPKIVGQPLTIFYSNIPCMLNCLTSLQGEEVSMLTSKPFLEVGKSPLLIEWFPCNEKIMTIAYLVTEMAKWNYYPSAEEYKKSQNQGYDEVKQLLYQCITDPLQNPKCYSKHMSFFHFCKLDTYLPTYNFLPCESDNSFVDFLDKSYLRFANREGKDIANDFTCSGSYFLCRSEARDHYDFNKCWPSWMTLSSQEKKQDGSRNYSLGRCEDFALLYYSLFRAIDTPAKDMKLKLGVCMMPCPCEQLIKDYGRQYNLSVEQYSCYVPANLSIDGLGEIDACKGIDSAPSSFEGKYVITADNGTHYFYWVVSQNFTDKGAPAFRNLSLDNNYSDDTIDMMMNGVHYTSPNVIDVFSLNSNVCIANLKDNVQGKNARYGFEINVTGLYHCANDSVILKVGFTNSEKANYYTLTEGERGIIYRGKVEGNPYFTFMDMNGKDVTTNYFGSKDDWTVSCSKGVSCNFVNGELQCTGGDCSYKDHKITCTKSPLQDGWTIKSGSASVLSFYEHANNVIFVNGGKIATQFNSTNPITIDYNYTGSTLIFHFRSDTGEVKENPSVGNGGWNRMMILPDFEKGLYNVSINGALETENAPLPTGATKWTGIIIEGTGYINPSHVRGVSPATCTIKTCDVNYKIVPDTAGVIVDDPCYTYHTSDPVSACDAFIVDGSVVEKGDFSTRFPTKTLSDLIK